MKSETWMPISGFANRYMISNLGNVISLNYKQTNNTKLLTPTLCKRTGYKRVKLTQFCKSTTISIHRLIALHFIPNPENKCDVNHKNGVKTDNRIENLEWTTRKENIHHAIRIGLHDPSNNKKKIRL